MKIRLPLLVASALGLGLIVHAQQTEWLPSASGWSSEISYGSLKEADTGAFIIGHGYHTAERHYVGLEGLFFKADDREVVSRPGLRSELDASMLFATYRYRYPWAASGRFALHVGGSAGLSWMKVSGDVPVLNVSVTDRSKGDWAGALFAGLEWRFSQNLGIHARYRWLRVYDTEFYGVKSDYKDEVIEAGFSLRY